MAAGDSEDSAQDGFKAFATDLLHAFDVVRERRNRSTKGCDLLLGLIQQRMVAERSYAKDLFSCSKVDFEYEEDSSLREAVESMKAHLVNKSVQVSEVGNLQRSLKNLEEKYRKAKVKYDRAYREALAAGDEMRRAGLVPPPAAPLPGEREEGEEEKEEGEKRPVGASQGEGEGEQAGGSTAAAGGGGEVAGGEAGEAACQEKGRQGATPSPAGESEEAANGDAAAAAPNGTADGAPGGGGGRGGGRGAFLGGGGRSLVQRGLRAAKSKAPARLSGAVQKIGGITKKDYTGWLLPSKEQKQEEKIQAAKGLLSAAEALRLECIDLWEEYHRVEITEIHDYQCILTSFQKIEELHLAEARDGLRKQLVLEASALANQQYDVQMLFKVMDAINATSDLVSFINAARAQSLRDCFTNPESKFYNTIPLVEMDNTGPRRRPEAAAARAPALPPPPHPVPLAWPPPPMRQDPADNAPPVDLTVTAKTAPEVLGRADLAGAWAAYLAEHPGLRPAAAGAGGGEEEGEEDAGGGAEAQALGTAAAAAEGAGDTPPPPPPPPAAPASFVADLLHTEARPFSRRAYSCTVLLWPEAAATEGGNEEDGGAEEGGGGGGGRRRIFYVASDDDDDHGGGEDGEEGSGGGEEEEQQEEEAAATRGEVVDPVAACEELLGRHPRCFVRELFPFQASAAAAEGERPREAAAFRALLEDLGAGDGGGGGGGGDGGAEEEGEEDRRGLRRAAEACAPVLQSSYQTCALFFSMFSAKISIENQEDISSYDEQAKEALVVLLKAILDCAMQKEAYDLSNNVIAIAFQLASGEPSWEGLPPGLGAHPAWRAPATWAAALAHALGALGGGGDGGGGGGGEGSITSTLLLPPEAEALLSKKLGIRCRQVQACQVSFWANLMVDAGIDSVQVLGLIREHTSSSLDEETQLMSAASNSPEDRGNDEDISRHLSEFILKRCLNKLGEN